MRRLFFGGDDADFYLLETRLFQPVVQVAFGKTQPAIAVRGLVNLIVDAYKQIYKEEDESVGRPTGNIPRMFNRATSEGKYGI